MANFGWISFIGVVTGFSETIGLGEKYWNSQPASELSVRGETWTFVTRDLLSSRSVEEAIALLQHKNRTCAIFLGLGDRATNTFRGLQVAARALNIFDDSSLSYAAHPAIKGIVYWDKYDQPSSNFCFAELLEHFYGYISVDVMALDIGPIAQTGDLHAAVFDYGNMIAYFSNARLSNVTSGGLNAYERTYTRLDMKKLFAVTN